MPNHNIPFELIHTVLLDLDGTLLDKYFDDYFWEHHVPEKYAERHQIPFVSAHRELMDKYKDYEGTLNWTDLDFWSNELDLDIPGLKEQIKHLIGVHPRVEEFLQLLKNLNKEVFLVTNAHHKSLELKLEETKLGKFFDSILTSFDIGYPKEAITFWGKAEQSLKFQKKHTLFIDDTEEILRTARQYGIEYLIFKAYSSSKLIPAISREFFCISGFDEIM